VPDCKGGAKILPPPPYTGARSVHCALGCRVHSSAAVNNPGRRPAPPPDYGRSETFAPQTL